MRTLAPETFSDEFVGNLNHVERLLWIGMITIVADDQGRMQDNSALIRNLIFPYDDPVDVSRKTVEAGLEKFEHVGKIHRYAAGANGSGKKLIQISNWWRYQKSASWMAASIYPSPDGWVDRCRYHGKERIITMTNWDQPGGFLPSALLSQLPTPLPRPLPRLEEEEEEEEEEESTTTTTGKVFKVYESEIGILTPRIKDTIGDYLDNLKISPDWIIDAIHEASSHNKRNWAYCAAILKRWAVEGKSKPPSKEKPNTSKYRYKSVHETIGEQNNRAVKRVVKEMIHAKNRNDV